jgi:hypothetical protein
MPLTAPTDVVTPRTAPALPVPGAIAAITAPPPQVTTFSPSSKTFTTGGVPKLWPAGAQDGFAVTPRRLGTQLVLNRSFTSPELKPAIARSGRPSPSKSADVTTLEDVP